MKIQLIKKIIITLITLQLIIAPVYVSAMGNSEKIIKPNNNNIDIDSLIEELLKAIANQKKNIPFNLIENIHINYINDESLLKVNGGNNGLPLGDRITINAILAPVLSSPEDGTFMNDNTPLLTWEYVYEAFDYNVQVSSNSQFTNLVVNTYTGLYTEYTCPTPSDNQYWWRVCGVEFGGTNGPWSNVRSFTVDTTPPAAPTLVSPEDNFPTNDNTPSFSWNTVVTAVNYQIQIDDNSDFGSPVISITTGTSTSFTVSSSLPDRPYYWHVRAQDSVGNWGSYSAYRRIYIDTDPVGTPVLVTPEDGSLYNYNTIDMDWTTVLSGYEYNIQLSRDIAFTDIVYNTFLQSTEITYSSLADDTYYWHVRARDIAGNWGTFSSTNFFVIDTTPPGTPTLSSPDDEVITSDNTPYFSWSPVDTANLYQIQIDDNADCSSPFITYSSGSTSYTPASLADNVYYWRVRARDAAGNYGNWSEIRSIIVDTTAPTINDVVVVPDTLDDDDVIAVYCNVTDLNGISQVNLYYRINSGEWGNIPMTWIFDNHYEATLGTFAYDDLIEFYITADDIADTANQAIDDNGGLYYSFTIESSDYTAPVINSISINPTSPEDDDYVYFNCHATDANGIQSVTVYYRVNGGEWGAILMDYITGSEYEVSHTPFGYGDFIEYYFVAIDNSPNHNTATNDNGGSYYYFTVESSDHYNPVIENIQHNPSIPTDEDTITISCEATDASGIQSVTLYYRINEGSWTSVSMVFISGSIYEVTIGAFNYNDFIEYYIVVVDNSPNHNSATYDNSGSYYDFTVVSGDVTLPIIQNIENNPISPEDDDIITVQCNVTDINGIQLVTLYYRVNGGSWTSLTMALADGNIYEVEIGPFDYDDFIEYYIVAIDNSPNHNNATNDNGGLYYNFTILSSDHTTPSIENIQQTPLTPTDEETIIISCEVTDASGIQSVTLYYRINEGSWTSVSMVLVDGSTYGITIGTFSYNDFIEYYIIAIDNSPNHNIITDNNNGLYYSFVITAGSTTSTSSTNIAYFIPILALFGIASISLFRKKQ